MIVEKDMHPPIYVYYKLTNYYQNHRRYVKSRNEKQLRGDVDILPKTLEEDCAPKYYYEPDSPTPFSPPAGFGRDSENNDLAHAISPCGLIAWSYFNDSFFLKRDGVAFAPEEISHRGIAWATDVSTRHAPPQFFAAQFRRAILRRAILRRPLLPSSSSGTRTRRTARRA